MIVLIVHSIVRAGAEAQAREYIRILQAHSRQEPGCRLYIGHQSTDNPQHFLFYEQYEDDAALAAHRAAPYFEQYVTNGLATIIEARTSELYRLVD